MSAWPRPALFPAAVQRDVPPDKRGVGRRRGRGYNCLVPVAALGTCSLGLRVWRNAEDGASSWLRDGQGGLSLNITGGLTVLQ